MRKAKLPVYKRSLFSWVFARDVKLQLLLVVTILITVFARVLPLEMQKRIVNQAISLRKVDLLLIYCGVYLIAVVSASGLKYLINVLQTVLGQRATADMRTALYEHILTLPLGFFRKTQPGMVVSALVTELAAAGEFVGMAVAVPVTSVLTLLAFAGFLLWLNPLLALVSLSIYPIVLFVVPFLQNRANRENKKRVDVTRLLSSKIAESISGIHEIQGNGAYRIENRKYARLVNDLMKTRIVWNLYRFGIKVTNNFFNSLSPFLIFILGGYLAIHGQLGLGALVAFLSAQEKLYDPWKELIEFYQSYQDAAVSYNRTMEYFDAEPEFALAPVDRKPYALEGSLKVKDLAFVTEDGIRLLDGISLDLQPGEHLALVGFSGSGKSTLALCLGQLYKYSHGQILLGQKDLAELTKRDVVAAVGIVSQSPFIFDGTIEENLLYAYEALEDDANAAEFARPSLDDMIEVLQQTGIFVDVLRFGLNAILQRATHQDLAERLVPVRKNFQRHYGRELADYVEFFDESRYLYHSSVFENLTFGAPNREAFDERNLPRNDFFLAFLADARLKDPLLALGAELSRTTVDILGNLPPDNLFFEQSPILPEELDLFKQIVDHLKRKKIAQLPAEDIDRLLELALRFTPGRHKMVALTEKTEPLILQGRRQFRERVIQTDPEAFSFYRRSHYIFSQTILNNIFFGKTTTTLPRVQEKIDQYIIQLLIEEDLLETIAQIGLTYQVGSKGDKLSGGQRQKLAIARTFLKTPAVLIMDEATSGLDNNSQARIQKILDTRWKGKSTLIAVVHRLDIIKDYDKVAVMKAGKIVELGTYDELTARKGMLYELVHGKR